MWVKPIGTARKVQAAEKAASTAASLGVVVDRACGLCPECGYANPFKAREDDTPESDSVYCAACGHVWAREERKTDGPSTVR